MDCLTPEQMVRYLRGNGDDPRAVEGHVRECPGCAMELLLARETLHGLPAPARSLRPASSIRRALAARQRSWVPWAAAAAVLFAAVVLFALRTPPAPTDPLTTRPVPSPTKPAPAPIAPPTPPKPEVVKETPPPPPPRPLPVPPPKAETPVVVVPERKTETPPVRPPEPKPEEPRKTVAERAVVARVLNAVGSAPGVVGREVRAGDTLATARQEFVVLELDGLGHIYVRENSRAEIGAAGALSLHEGELLARLAPGKKPASVRTPQGELDVDSDLFDLHASKTATEITVVSGRVAAGGPFSQGPITMHVKAGKGEAKPVEAGFAGWLPDKLASRKFMAWIEGESFQTLQGFRALEQEGTSGGKAAVQVEDRAAMTHKLALPFKARHVVWVRVRQYVPKTVAVGILTNGQQAPDLKLEGAEGRPWRWVGPLAVTSDRLDLGVTALTRFPFRENDERRSFPVVVDAVIVTADLKFVPPERPPEEHKAYDLVLEPIAK